MDKKNLIPALIDNKNIMEDFSDDFHYGEFVEYAEGRIHHQAFWCRGALCVLSYQFGSNWFSLDFVHATEGKKREAAKELAKVMLSYRENFIIVEGAGGVYWIYFKPEEDE